MLLNYIKIAYRNLIRHKMYSVINVAGLAVGMACAILLFLFIRDELSYEKHNSKYHRICIVKSRVVLEGVERFTQTAPSLSFGEVLENEFPSVEESARLYNPESTIFFVGPQGKIIGEDNVWYADPEIFNIFDHRFVYGKPEGALNTPDTIIISDAFAQTYFGNKNPVGEVLSRKEGRNYLVKGVFEDLPQNSSHRYDVLMPITEVIQPPKFQDIGDGMSIATGLRIDAFTYILLSKKTRISDLVDNYVRFSNKILTKSGLPSNTFIEPVFQSLSGVHLDSKPWPNSPINVRQLVYIMSGIALLVLAIACINYMNHATARSLGRAREVGVRKVLGAGRASLVKQFLCESVTTALASMIIALVLIELFLPAFNNIVGRQLHFKLEIELLIGMLLITLLTGLIAGSYPAFFLSSFLPAKVLREGTGSGVARGSLRKILVVIQYAISVAIVICTMVLIGQMNYIQNKDLGFSKDNVFFILPNNLETSSPMSAFKEALLNYSGILGAAESSKTAGGHGANAGSEFKIENSSRNLVEKQTRFITVDHDFIDLMKMKVRTGRSFNKDTKSDQAGVLINEALVKEMGWTDSPVGKRVVYINWEYKVLGVLKDFHFGSLHSEIKPLIIMLKGDRSFNFPSIVSIKVHPENTDKTLEFVRDKWFEMDSTHTAEILSLEDTVDNQYRTEKAAARIFFCSAVLGIFVSCLGLFGFSSFVTQRKTKEIGIRKAFGAPISRIVFHMTFDFLKLVFFSTIIAWPIAYYTMGIWLDRFAYRVEMTWQFFILSSVIALLIALITVAFHTVKAAMTDPAMALRNE